MTAPLPIHVDPPGSFIEEELEARGWTKGDLAFALGMSLAQLSPILNGKQGISPAMARALGDAFDVPADFFANLQKMYELAKAPAADPGVRKRAQWLSTFPVREMADRGWIENGDPALLDLQLLRFFEKNRVDDIPFVGDGPILAHAARKQSYDAVTPVQFAWLYRVKRIADQMDAPPFDRDALEATLPTIRARMLSKDDVRDIPAILRDCGVRLVFVEGLRGAKIDGVCVWNDGQPAIGMTLQRNRLDNFCFVLRHETEHVLKGDGREESFTPPDDVSKDFLEDPDLPEEEKRANEAAGEFLVPRKRLDSFIARKAPYISERDVLQFAASLQINPSVVVGQIQYRMDRYNWLRKYQKGMREVVLSDWEFTDGWGHTFPTGL